MKKFLAIIIAACMLLTLFAGCRSQASVQKSDEATKTQAAQADDTKKAEEPKKEQASQNATLKLYLATTDQKPILEEINAGFMGKNPGIKLELDVSGGGQFESILKTKIAAGETPDVFSVWSGGLMAEYGAKGHLMDLTSQPYIDRLTDLSKSTMTLKGKVYAIPWNMVPEGLFYNKKIFSDLKLNLPTNWDEFLAACDTVKKNNIIPLSSGFKDDWVLIRFVNAAYPSIVYGRNPKFDEQLIAGQVKFSDKNSLEVYQKLRTLVDKGYFDKSPLSTSYDQANNIFAQGKAAMYIQGSWALTQLQSGGNIDIGFMPLPVNNKGEEMMGCWHVEIGMAASAKTKYPEAVNKYFDYFTSNDVYKNYITKKKVYSVVKGVSADVNPVTDEFKTKYVDTNKVTTWAHEYWPNSFNMNWRKKLQELVAKGITPDDIVKWMDDEYAKSENLYK